MAAMCRPPFGCAGSCYRLTNLHTVRHLSLGHDRVAHLLLRDELEALEAVRNTERGLRSVK